MLYKLFLLIFNIVLFQVVVIVLLLQSGLPVYFG